MAVEIFYHGGTLSQIMKVVISILVVALLIAIILLIPKGSGRPPGGEYLPGEILVKFKPTTQSEVRDKLKSKFKVKEETYIESISVYHWKGDFDVQKAIEELKNSGEIIYAEPNYRVHTQTPAN
jgi:hypothetical protein